MKFETFTIKNGKMLFWRLGNMNSNKQVHWGDPEHSQPPTKRGIWVFPYPHYDLFFCWHQWEKHLPKKFRTGGIGIKYRGEKPNFDKMSDEEAKEYHAEKERLIKKIRKENRPTTFWYNGEFYSRISKDGTIDLTKWFLWDSATQWAKVARKTLYGWGRFPEELVKFNYSKDHLEIFIPNY